MTNPELINSIKAIENNDKQYLLKAFALLIKHESVLSKNELSIIKEKIVECIIVDFDLYEDLAKINYLEKEVLNFPDICLYILEELDHPNHTKNTEIVKENVISNLRYIIIEIKKNAETSERSRIQINQEVTLLLAFMKAMREEFTTSETISDYRLSQLVSDNFSDKKGKAIDLQYCKNKFSTGNGISIHGNEKLKSVLENILRKIQ
jgi:hypothetical protein